MAKERKGFFETALGQSVTQIHTKATAENRYKRIGMLVMGLILIVTGIIVWINAAQSGKPQPELLMPETTVIETTVAGK